MASDDDLKALVILIGMLLFCLSGGICVVANLHRELFLEKDPTSLSEAKNCICSCKDYHEDLEKALSKSDPSASILPPCKD
ncbi:unnamed protein product [Arabis nemorensis]|uniref:Uncharacterized protein n=1 Tax=Arabis nemorensis TaxID=586526 RepID=A0A565CW28_9BRAS|nr:unnamed protein product [Arabis nemorensis]